MMSDDGSVEGMSAWAERLAGDDNFDEDEDGDLSPLQGRSRFGKTFYVLCFSCHSRKEGLVSWRCLPQAKNRRSRKQRMPSFR